MSIPGTKGEGNAEAVRNAINDAPIAFIWKIDEIGHFDSENVHTETVCSF
jgi:hypothetical protein